MTFGSLAYLATDPSRSRGRLHPEPDVRGGWRGPFARDRDRIVHSIAFRRLRHKTQVFVAPDGDHFRVRLTHSLEVAQIARTLARALGADEDLTEAIALAHDIGHPPFGHAGEAALRDAMADVGGFDHNAHTLRVLTRLEDAYPAWPGLNLSWETLEGLAKHNGPVREPGWALAEVDAELGLELARWPGLEAQVAAIADDIAYDNHDIDDGLRAGLLDPAEVTAHPFVADSWRAVRARYPGTADVRLLSELVREQIARMVTDVIASTRARAAELAGPEAVRGADHATVAFSPEMAAGERAFKAWMYEKIYHSAPQRAVAEQAGVLIGRLARAYREDPSLLPQAWRERLPDGEIAQGRHVGDFIAGMTDRYAIARHREIVGPVDLPEGF